jgi:hypothetical protein
MAYLMACLEKIHISFQISWNGKIYITCSPNLPGKFHTNHSYL